MALVLQGTISALQTCMLNMVSTYLSKGTRNAKNMVEIDRSGNLAALFILCGNKLTDFLGYETTIVDYFEGDALPDFFMKYLPGTDLDSYDNLTPEVSLF